MNVLLRGQKDGDWKGLEGSKCQCSFFTLSVEHAVCAPSVCLLTYLCGSYWGVRMGRCKVKCCSGLMLQVTWEKGKAEANYFLHRRVSCHPQMSSLWKRRNLFKLNPSFKAQLILNFSQDFCELYLSEYDLHLPPWSWMELWEHGLLGFTGLKIGCEECTSLPNHMTRFLSVELKLQ